MRVKKKKKLWNKLMSIEVLIKLMIWDIPKETTIKKVVLVKNARNIRMGKVTRVFTRALFQVSR